MMNTFQNCGELVQAYKERIKCENLGCVSGVSNGLGDVPATTNSSNGINSPKKSSGEVSTVDFINFRDTVDYTAIFLFDA
ncbi:hypothetical protein Y032_0025g1209 [Ancylostoma ceylanicum]|uniref:Uncharacterized protein n=1 Tax=Ancylostoma ceylanicum TaxID=53326 RepID=A0A016UXG8_9BILA|nr:hypothetical protein Y032_0025g1209 [Ancylostoma ceylanicum]